MKSLNVLPGSNVYYVFFYALGLQIPSAIQYLDENCNLRSLMRIVTFHLLYTG
jgi:hypothetical protein